MKEIFERTKTRDLMVKAICIYQDDDFSQAQIKFKDNKAYYLVVVDSDDKYVGTLSQKFLFKAQSPRKILQEGVEDDPNIIIDGDSFYEKSTLDSYILKKIMYKGAHTLKPEDSLATAVVDMSHRNITCIPIVDDERKVHGVLTNERIIDFIAHKIGD